ncbi:MAG: hypothetical protein SFU84_12610 [Gemmatimonadales bacterium]|nr:hypothetical protein [Gemmatimonadales bacterium]
MTGISLRSMVVITLLTSVAGDAFAQQPADAISLATWFGRGAAQAAPCRTPSHGGFDFWIGEWRVRGAAGRDAGPSSISKDLGGCAVSERFGTNGRSLSGWRESTAEWIQTYVDNSGLTLRLRGVARPDSMVLADSVRVIPGGQGMALASRFIWSKRPDGTVRQVWFFSRDGGATWPVNFDGTYTATAPGAAHSGPQSDSSAAAPGPCSQRPAFRAMDGLLGAWQVVDAEGGVVGTSMITAGLSGCVLEERFTTSAGFVRTSIILYDSYVREWVWASADANGIVERFVARAGEPGSWGFVNERAGTAGFCVDFRGSSGPVIRADCAHGDGPGSGRFAYRRNQ